MADRTDAELAQAFKGMGHSIAFITDIIAGNTLATESVEYRQDCVDRHTMSLEILKAMPDWGSENFTATDSAISAGNSYTAS